ncbi:hypothetical protein [Ruegeria sp. ANG-S4]|uniref:hypothetical protein n=1 Tax=Ruegeria sp. ANG-S4 TaxID=1577904 RepID=UPI000A4B1929|nr:hypothetical protein [Ruegeria sp. ANG-S4]
MHYLLVIVMFILCAIGLSFDVPTLRYDFALHTETMLPLIVAVGVIYWFYSARFAEWSADSGPPVGFPARPTSHYTTRLRYHLFVLAYCSMGLIALLVIYAAPQNIMAIVCKIPGSVIPECEQSLESISKQSIEALVLGLSIAIALLNLPSFDARWRSTLQRAADIPSRATNLVGMLHDRFDLFAADPERVRNFIVQYNAQQGAPRLFLGDFYAPSDEGYLETYPRCEYILFELSNLDEDTRRSVRMSDFSSKIKELGIQLSDVRQDVVGLHRTLGETLGRRFAGDFAKIHDSEDPDNIETPDLDGKSGPKVERERIRRKNSRNFEGRLSEEFAITKLDNILEDVELSDDDGQSANDEVLRDFMLKRLGEISEKSQAVYADLLKIVVLMSLRSTASPQWFLEHLGFELSRGEADQTEVAPWLVMMVFILVILVTMAFGVVDPSNMIVTFSFSLGMLGTSVFGGFLVASLIADSYTDFKSRTVQPDIPIMNLCWFFMMPMLSSLLSVIVVGQFYPIEAKTAQFFTPVAGWLGLYVAVTTYRERLNLQSTSNEVEEPELDSASLEVRTEPADLKSTRTGRVPSPLPTRPPLNELLENSRLMKVSGISYHPRDWRWLIWGAFVLTLGGAISSGLPFPTYFIITLFLGGYLVPLLLFWTNWLIDREIRRRSLDDRMAGQDWEYRTNSSVWLDLRYLLVVRTPLRWLWRLVP